MGESGEETAEDRAEGDDDDPMVERIRFSSSHVEEIGRPVDVLGHDLIFCCDEDAGENLFVVKNGVVYTPDLSAGALNGITRNTVFAICEDLGLKLVEKRITRDEVYICDEAFFTGTAAEVTPIRELDRIELGSGSRGPITEKIQSAFFDIVNGRNPKYAEWLSKV